jgi:hypothetical protein
MQIPKNFTSTEQTTSLFNWNDYLGKISLVTPREVAEEIRTNLNLK